MTAKKKGSLTYLGFHGRTSVEEEEEKKFSVYTSKVLPSSVTPLHKTHMANYFRLTTLSDNESRPISDELADSSKHEINIQDLAEIEGKEMIDKNLELIDVETQLSEMEAAFIVCVLESIVDMLDILTHTNVKPRAFPDVTYLTLKERFGELYKEQPLIDPDSSNPIDLDSEHAKFKKIQRERASFQDTLEKTIVDLSLKGNYKSLENFVVQRSFTQIEEEELLRQKKKIDVAVANLKLEIQKQKCVTAEKRTELENDLAVIRDELHCVLVKNFMEEDYIKKWEDGRTQQHRYALEEKENHLKTSLTETKFNMDKEMLSNNHITEFLSLDIHRMMKELEMWSDKSFSDLEQIDLDTKIAKTNLNNVQRETEEIRTICQKRTREILTYFLSRHLRRLYAEKVAKRERAAICIQRWWQEMMKLHKLGPYKIKKKNKKKKGKKKK